MKTDFELKQNIVQLKAQELTLNKSNSKLGTCQQEEEK